MNKTFFSFLLLCILTLLPFPSIAADDSSPAPSVASFDAALDQFEIRPTAENANTFYKLLFQAGFFEEPYVADPKMSRDALQADVWYWATEWYYAVENYPAAVQFGQQALAAAKSLGDKTLEADCASLLSLVYVRTGQFDKAAVYAKRCNEIDVEGGDHNNIASSYNTLAGIYMTMRQVEEAEKYIVKAIEQVEQTDNLPRKAVIYGMASEVYQNKHDFEQAYKHAAKALSIEQQLQRTDKIAIRQAQCASALIGLKRYEESKNMLAEAIPILRESDNHHSLGIALIQMGDVLHREKQDSLAVPYYEEAIGIFEAQHDLFNLSQAHDGMRNALRHIDPERALHHNDIYFSLRDSLYDHETGELLSKYAAEYDNYALREQNEQERIQYQKRIRIIIVISAVLLLLLLVLGILYYFCQRRSLLIVRAEMERVQRALLAQESVKKSSRKKSSVTEGKEEILNEEDDLLRRVVMEVNGSLESRDYNVERIAERMNMTPRTFSRRMRELTGGTAKDFICAVQMERARDLLLNQPDMPVSEIAMQCGFEEASSFTHTFRRVFSMSPTQFREQAQ